MNPFGERAGRAVRHDAGMNPETLWWLSTRSYRRGWTIPAKLLKLANFALFKAVLPYECEIHKDINLWHRGLATVIRPKTSIGSGASIGHSVTIGGTSTGRVAVGDNVTVGAGAIFIPRRGITLTIGDGAIVGAGSVVIHPIDAYDSVAGNPARSTKPRSAGEITT